MERARQFVIANMMTNPAALTNQIEYII